MKIKDAIISINDLVLNTDNKKEKDIYNSFSSILKSLENLNLTEDQLLLIWNKIEELDLSSNQEKKLKYLKTKLNEFIIFLKNEIHLIQEWYYTWIWMVFWMVFGIAFATSLRLNFGMWDETTWWLIVGMVIWMFVWVIMDSNAKKENHVFKVK